MTSPNSDQDFSCGPVCRWGDYSGASTGSGKHDNR